MSDHIIRRFIELKLLVLVKPGDKCWEAYSEGSKIQARGDTPDEAVKNFERLMKEGNPDTRVREVVQYIKKTVETVGEPETKEGEPEAAMPLEEMPKRRGRPRKTLSLEGIGEIVEEPSIVTETL